MVALIECELGQIQGPEQSRFRTDLICRSQQERSALLFRYHNRSQHWASLILPSCAKLPKLFLKTQVFCQKSDFQQSWVREYSGTAWSYRSIPLNVRPIETVELDTPFPHSEVPLPKHLDVQSIPEKCLAYALRRLFGCEFGPTALYQEAPHLLTHSCLQSGDAVESGVEPIIDFSTQEVDFLRTSLCVVNRTRKKSSDHKSFCQVSGGPKFQAAIEILSSTVDLDRRCYRFKFYPSSNSGCFCYRLCFSGELELRLTDGACAVTDCILFDAFFHDTNFYP